MSIINIKNQSQFELFPQRASDTSDTAQPRLLLKDLTVSIENTIVCFVLLLLFLVLSYAFGVERGKKLASANLPVKVELAKPQKVISSPVKDVPAVMANFSKQNEKIAPIPAAQKPVVNESPRKILLESLPIGYTVQVASFSKKKQAEFEASSLKQKGYDIFLLEKGVHTIVCVGRFDEKIKANNFANRLRNKYRDCLVRRF
ncbi:MAG: SPOR domain-containing protein [Candidatus Omnitrophica bacterium]|nr:SPOR domain-containing protein [Candidatus Omnitrophota bacterium]